MLGESREPHTIPFSYVDGAVEYPREGRKGQQYHSVFLTPGFVEMLIVGVVVVANTISTVTTMSVTTYESNIRWHRPPLSLLVGGE